jgi:hypothetical protein
VRPGEKLSYQNPQLVRDNHQITITADNSKRLLQEIERVKKELADENIKLEEFAFTEVPGGEKKDYEVELSLETNLFFRAICKIMVNFYVFRTRKIEHVQKGIEFIRSDIPNNFGWFLNLDISKLLHNKKPYHILIIKGSRKQKALYGYFEMFGEIGYVGLLNGNYRGEDVCLSYTFDPVNITEIKYDYDFNLNVTELINLIYMKPGFE